MPNQPNILLIMTDQQRYDSLGCYGSKVVSTPNLDRLGEKGMIFENCYVNNTICTPSRASILTGKTLPGHGVYRLHDILPEDELLFTEKLQKQGYKTGLFGKLHVSGRVYEKKNRHPHDGFDVYEYGISPNNPVGQYNEYGKWLKNKHPKYYKKLKNKGREIGHIPAEVHFTHWAAERTMNFIKKRDKDKPFFAYMSVVDPHDPYNNHPEEMEELIDKEMIKEPIKTDTFKPEGVIREQQHSYLGGFNNYTPDQIKQMRVGYYASLAFFDREVGRVIDLLKKEGIRGETAVIFVSDHGDMLGDHGLLAKGAFFYDPSVKVPLIINYPEEIEGRQRIEEPVQPHNIAATVLKLSGYPEKKLKEEMPDSQDLIVKNENHFAEPAVCLYRNTGICDNKLYWDPPINATMIRDEKYKLNIYHSRFEGELFDMKNDPLECNNLWFEKAYERVKDKLIKDLFNWMIENELNYNRSQREVFPEKSDWSQNNPL